MNSYQKLLKNTGVFFIANFGSKILTFLLVRFYTELLSPSEYGRIDLLNTTVNLAIPVVTLCITEAVLRFSIDDTENRSKIYSNGIMIIIIGCLLFTATAPIFIVTDFLKQDIGWLYLLTITNSLYTVTSHFARGIGKSKVFALSGLIHTFLQVMLNIVLLVGFSFGITGYFIASVLANVITFVIVMFIGKLWQYAKLEIDKIYLKSMIVYSAPLIPNSIFWWIMQSSDKYVINYMMNDAANGLYAVATKIPTIITTISSIFFQAWQLSSVDEVNSENKSKFYSNVFKMLSMLLIVSTSIILVLLRVIFKVLVEKSYYSAWNCTPFLLCAMLFSCFSSFLGTNYVAMKKTKGVFLTTVVGAVANVVLNIILTPVLGIRGTALATAISFGITWIIRSVDTRKFVKIHYPFRTFICPLVLVLIQATLLTFHIESYLYQTIVLALILLLYADQLIFFIKKAGNLASKILGKKER